MATNLPNSGIGTAPTWMAAKGTGSSLRSSTLWPAASPEKSTSRSTRSAGPIRTSVVDTGAFSRPRSLPITQNRMRFEKWSFQRLSDAAL